MIGPNENIICPNCAHQMTPDEMERHQDDLWAIAPNESEVDITCPGCGVEFVCQGGYIPNYTTWIGEEE